MEEQTKIMQDDGTNNVVELLQKLQEWIIQKEGEADKTLQAYISNGNCRLDNLYRLAYSHQFRLIVQHPLTKQWHAYGDSAHEMVKQICFLFVEQNENYSITISNLGLTKKSLDNWCLLDNYPLLKPFLILSTYLGFRFNWIPQTHFCKNCKYSMSFPRFPQLNLCWHPKSKRNRISLDNQACEHYMKPE